MREDDLIRLRHMIDAADEVGRFVAGRERADFDTDPMLLFAVVRGLEVVGEAAAQVSAEARAGAPDVPWRALVGMRNRIIHAYWDVDKDIVWKAATEEVPALLPLLRRLLEMPRED